MKNEHYLETKLESMAAAGQEAKDKWAKDNPNREPGTSTRTWKSFSAIRFSSSAYRAGWESIDWGSA